MYEPRIVTPTGTAGADVNWDATIPMQRWKPSSKGIGGSARFGANQQEAYERSRDELVAVVIVCLESQWQALRTALAWAQKSGQSFKFRFDKATVGTEYTVYLESPAQGEELAPQPSQNTVFAFELPLVLRSYNGTPFDVKITTI